MTAKERTIALDMCDGKTPLARLLKTALTPLKALNIERSLSEAHLVEANG